VIIFLYSHIFSKYTTVSADYTSFLLALRYTCLGLSIVVAIHYWYQLRKMRGEKLVFEQKYIRVLGFLLILFNDPILASTILHPTLARYYFGIIEKFNLSKCCFLINVYYNICLWLIVVLDCCFPSNISRINSGPNRLF